MKTLALAVLLSLAACGIPTRTAYNADHTQSWMCVPNTKVQYPPLRNAPPLVMIDPAAEQPKVATAPK